MFDESRINIYDYLYNLVYGEVSNNVYRMGEPTENTESDVNDGFLVIDVAPINDESEFPLNVFGRVRCYITAYVPKRTRGRLNKELYKSFETSINRVINGEMADGTHDKYYILPDSVLSMEDNDTTPKGNQYHLFVKSFVIDIDNISTDFNLYIGYGGATIETMSDIESLGDLHTYHVEDAGGEYALAIPQYNYLWICYKRRIRGAVANGFAIPLDEPITIDGINCYRSHNAIQDENMVFSII